MIGETIEYLNPEKTRYIKYTMENAIKIVLSGRYTVNIEDFDKNNNIKELVLDDLVFENGQTIEVKINDITYNLRIITIKKNKNKYELLLENRNKSSIFVVPSLGYDSTYFSYDKLFVNSFLARKELKEEVSEVYLVYRSTKANDYIQLDEKLRKHPNYVDSYDFGNTDILLRFDIPEKYIPEVKKFVEGSYSMFSKDFKIRILNFFNGSRTLIENLKMIFNKDKQYIKNKYPKLDDESLEEVDEVFSKVNMEDEKINV